MSHNSTLPVAAFFANPPAYIVAIYVTSGLAALAACVLSALLMGMHWRYYSQPTHQRYIIRILGLIPFYTICSFLSIMLINYSVYIALLRDSYEAYVIYQFFRLCLNFAGGQEELERKLAGSPKMKLPQPLCRVEVELDHRFMQRMKQGILQYVIVRPVTSILAVVFELLSLYGEGDYSGKTAYLYLVIINNISFTWALYCLVAFYFATRLELSPYRPLLKFITIKVAVFFSFWQGIFIAILCAVGAIQGFWLYTSAQAGIVLNSMVICLEMCGISIMHIWAYPVDLYRVMAMSQAPLIHDVRRSTSVLASVRHTLAQGDTLRDTVDAFAPKSLQQKFVNRPNQPAVAQQQQQQQQRQQQGAIGLADMATDDENNDFNDPHANALGLADDSDKVTGDARR